MIENNERLSVFFSSRKMNLVVVVYFIFAFISRGLSNINVLIIDWQTWTLTLSYSYGFIKRALLGSIVKIFAVNLNLGYKKALMGFMSTQELLFAIVLLSFLLFMINKYKDPHLNMLITLFLSTDIVGMYFWDWGSPDALMLSITLLICLLLVRNRYIWTVPVLISLCVMIHEGYVLIFGGMVFALLLYQCIQKEGKDRKKYIVVLAASLILCGALSVYFYTCTKLAINATPSEVIEHAENILGVNNYLANLLFCSIYGSYNEIWENGLPTELFFYTLMADAIAIVFLFPLIVYNFIFWKDIIHNEPKRIKKLGYLCFAISFLSIIPLFIFHKDHGRWFFALIFQEFMTIAFLYLSGDMKVKVSLSKHLKISLINVVLIAFYSIFFLNLDKWCINPWFGIPYAIITGHPIDSFF